MTIRPGRVSRRCFDRSSRMTVFPDRLVADMERLPGAQHCYLKQMCAADGKTARSALEAAVGRVGEPLAARAREMLSSLDNRRFFQGFAEVATLSAIHGAGWRLTDLDGAGPRLEMRRSGGTAFTLSVLAFLHQTRPGGDEGTRQRLVDALSRVVSRQRFAVHIRRWLPHDFDPEPIRRAIEMWLQQVQSGQWEGRYASYEDTHVSLEFCLTGEKAKPRQSPLVLTLGPFHAHRALEVLEPRAVREMDRHQSSSARHTPLIIACVADQPWALNPGYLRDFLYGRATVTVCEPGLKTWQFGGGGSVCAFRDPLYSGVSAVLLVDREPKHAADVAVRAYLNPWARESLPAEAFGVRAFAPIAHEPPIMAWYDALPASVRLG